MADITKGLFLLIILAVVIGVGIGAWEHFTDPRIQAHRDFQFDLQEQSQARLQPVLDTAKEITIYISLLFLAGIASEIVLVLHQRRQRMYPLGGLYQARVINPSLLGSSCSGSSMQQASTATCCRGIGSPSSS